MFTALSNDRSAIDDEFGQPPSWGTVKEPTVSLYLENATIKDPLDWHDQHAWIAERLAEFYIAFYKRLEDLGKLVVDKSPAKQLKLEYWTAFREVIEAAEGPIKPKKPQPQHWQDFSIGRSGIWLSSVINTQAKRIGVQLTLGSKQAKPYFYLLQQKKAELEEKFGGPFNWDEAPGKVQSRIGIHQEGCDPFDKSAWKGQHAWLLDQMHKFHATFAEVVKNLNADDYKPDKT